MNKRLFAHAARPGLGRWLALLLVLPLLAAACYPAAPGQPLPPSQGDATPPPAEAEPEPATPPPTEAAPAPTEETATPAAPAQTTPAALAKSPQQRVAAPAVAEADLARLTTGANAFALDLYQAVREGDGNFFLSPFSISQALAMTYAGARGQTGEQMAATLHFTLPQERLHPAFNALDLALASRSEADDEAEEQPSALQLNIANATWAQQGYDFLPAYLDVLAQNYGAGLQLLDFQQETEAARQIINEWVSQETAQRIEDLLPPGSVSPLTRLVLTNAIYFKASWQYKFEEALTAEKDFSLLDGSQVAAPLMAHGEGHSIGYVAGKGYEAVELPYFGGSAAMLLLAPDSGRFEDFERALTGNRVRNIRADLQVQDVSLVMPKFEFASASISLRQTLAGMGMTDAFTAGSADFSGMDGARDLFIDDVIHKAFVAVDEEGTEAAAATAVGMRLTSISDPVVVTIDRPFIFLIYDVETETILFLGRVLNPVQ